MYRKRSQMNQWDKVGDGFNRQTSATRTKLFDMESSSDEDQSKLTRNVFRKPGLPSNALLILVRCLVEF